MLLKDKVCIVTGAASLRGIGYATAELFAEHGAKVVVADVAMDDRVADEISASIEVALHRPADVSGIRCDIGVKSDCERLCR